jgi:hypothetical protein
MDFIHSLSFERGESLVSDVKRKRRGKKKDNEGMTLRLFIRQYGLISNVSMITDHCYYMSSEEMTAEK